MRSVWVTSFFLLSVQALAMGRHVAYPPMSDQFVEIAGSDAGTLNSLGIRVFYAKDRVEYNLDDVNRTHFHSDPVSLVEALQVARMIGNEYSFYPADCLKQSKIEKVLITSGMVRNYQTDAQDVVVPVTAAPLFGQGTMVYDFGLVKAVRSARAFNRYAFTLRVINHEYFHYLDFEMGLLNHDPSWLAINASSPTQYGNGGDFDRSPNAGIWDSSLVGYLDEYAESAMVEDRAEIFGGLTAHPFELDARIGTDQILARKVALLKSEIEQYCPSYHSFWQTERESLESRIEFLKNLN